MEDNCVMAEKLPYVPNYGVIAKALEKIKTAAAPPRFTQDFLATKLGLPGGTPRSVIPFLKRSGFLGSDGVPTELYKRFRNPAETGRAAAEALKIAYRPLYEINEYVHDLKDPDLKGVIVQATGLAPDAGTVKVILGSFKALKAFAKFGDEAEAASSAVPSGQDVAEEAPSTAATAAGAQLRLGLSYTINLNLPATSDITVFNAIFKSLREHLLK